MIISILFFIVMFSVITEVYGIQRGWYPGASAGRENHLPGIRTRYNESWLTHTQEETLESSFVFYFPLIIIGILLVGLSLYVIKKLN